MATFFLVWRVCVLVAALTAGVLMFLSLRKIPGGLSNPGRSFVISHFALLTGVSWGTAETIFEVGIGPLGTGRLALATFAVFMTFMSLQRFFREARVAKREGQVYQSGGWTA